MIQMVPTAEELHFRIEMERHVKATPEAVFDALVAEIGADNKTPDGTPMPLVLELFPGGRWYRDLGGDNGHFWAHVQAIKRPALLELTGPLFMSTAVSNNVQYRLTATDEGTVLRLVHQAFGVIPEDATDGMPDGWADMLDRVVERLD